MPPTKAPAKPDQSKEPAKPDKPDTPDTPEGNGPVEVTAEQLVIFYLKEARDLQAEKQVVYERIQSNRDTLRALAKHPNINDAQKKVIAELYPVKKGGGRKKNTETPAETSAAA